MVRPVDLARRLREIIAALDRRTARAGIPAEAAIAPVGDPTPFPVIPEDVAILTVHEFTFDLHELDGHRAPSMERICRTFIDDANRALVWWIRFGALQTWCASPEVRARTAADAGILRDAREVAASFPLNHRWEFDSTAFGRAVDGVALRRARTGTDPTVST